MRIKDNKYGLSLIETMISMSILLLVMIVGSEFIINGFRSIAFESEQQTAIKEARQAIDIVAKEIRKANSSARGDYAIASASPQSLIFYSDSDNDSVMEKVRFYLDTNTNIFKEEITEPGTPNDYTGTSTVSNVASYVNNQTEPIFIYHNANNAVTNTINSIRLIKINFKINVNPAIAPQDYYVETDINLRNLKDNL